MTEEQQLQHIVGSDLNTRLFPLSHAISLAVIAMALSGMVFVLTGRSSQARPVLTQKIKDAGGVCASSFTKKVTHVLCGSEFEETDKYLKSQKPENKGVFAVTEAFIDACIKAHNNSKPVPSATDFDPTNPDAFSKLEAVDEKEEESERGDEPTDASAPETEEITPSQKAKASTPRKIRPHKEALNNALKGWVVYIPGASKAKNELKDYVEENGGTVTGANSTAVTHILEECSSGKKVAGMIDLGAVVVDEDFIRETVDEFKPPKLLVPASPAKGKKKTVERVVSRRPFKGEMHYVVQYVGLEDEENELLSRDNVIARGGEKTLKKFESAWKKEMDVFNFSKSEPKGSPRKERKTTEAKTTTKKTETKAKASPKKQTKKTTEPKKTAPKKKTPESPSKKRSASPSKTAKEPPKKKTKIVDISSSLESPVKPKAKASPAKSKAKASPAKTKKTGQKKRAAPSPKASPRPTKRQRK